MRKPSFRRLRQSRIPSVWRMTRKNTFHQTAESAPPAKAEPTARIDPLERETPRSAMMGFLKYALLEDYETAARFARRP